MTLIFQNMSAKSAGSSNGVATTGKVSGDANVNSGEGIRFVGEQTFSQLMGNGTTSPHVSILTDVSSLLKGLLQNTPVQGDTTSDEDVVEGILNGLTEEISKIDELIETDPSIMLLLSNWLQQANALLNTNTDGNMEMDHNAQISSVLAEQPETIKFAVLDAVNQLVSMISKNEMMNTTMAQSIPLLASMHQILNQMDQEESPNIAVPVENMDKETVKGLVLLNNNSAKSTQVDQSASAQRNGNVVQSNATQASTTLKLDQLIQSLQNTVVTNTEEESSVVSVKNTSSINTTEITPDQGILTAGELLMRDGIKNPLKAAPVPVEKFSEEVTKLVVSKLDIVKLNGMTEAKISLYPEHLGQVDIKITVSNGQLIASFMTENAGAKGLLEQQMSQLRTALQSQGLHVERLEVTQNQNLQSHMYNDGRQPGTGQQQSNRKSKERESQSDDSMAIAEMTEELNDWLSEQVTIEQGNTFTAKA
ncbi:flagellar hook-length control protein FliK [Paenibacillus sp. CMAA1364]